MSHWSQIARERERERAHREHELLLAERDRERGRHELRLLRASNDSQRRAIEREQAERQTELLNAELADTNTRLSAILTGARKVTRKARFASLGQAVDAERTAAAARPATAMPVFQPPTPPGRIARRVPGARRRFEQLEAQAHGDYLLEVSTYNREAKRLASERDGESQPAEYGEQQTRLDRFQLAVEGGQPDAVLDYLGLALTASRLPDGFPKSHALALSTDAKTLVVDYQLPGEDIVPGVRRYYMEHGREPALVEDPVPSQERSARFREVVAATALRSLFELFSADDETMVKTIVFNGYVGDPAAPDAVCLISIHTSREAAHRGGLRRPNVQATLERLGARVSEDPAGLVGIEPITLADDVRPDIIQTTARDGHAEPVDLASIVPALLVDLLARLLETMGLELDRGDAPAGPKFDFVATDPRPAVGGQALVHFDRTSKTVGIRALRTLASHVQRDETAGARGIAIATAGFSRQARSFAQDASIELIDRDALLSMLYERLGVDATAGSSRRAGTDWKPAPAARRVGSGASTPVLS